MPIFQSRIDSASPAFAANREAMLDQLSQVRGYEEELKALGNSIGMGAMGFVGRSMVVDCHVEVACTHTGGMPMSVHSFCLSSRRAVARIDGGGAIAYRTDPKWFTPYLRRDTVEWQSPAESSRRSG